MVKKKKSDWKRVLGREALVRLQQNQRVGRVLKVSAEDTNEKGLKAPTLGMNTA